MKYIASILLIISFTGMAVFGLALFEMAPNHQSGCTSAIDGTLCPTNIVGFSTHHIAAFQALTSTVVTPMSGTILLLASLMLAGIAVLLYYKNWQHPKLELLHDRSRGLDLGYSHSKHKVTSWLSLFELSPSL